MTIWHLEISSHVHDSAVDICVYVCLSPRVLLCVPACVPVLKHKSSKERR